MGLKYFCLFMVFAKLFWTGFFQPKFAILVFVKLFFLHINRNKFLMKLLGQFQLQKDAEKVKSFVERAKQDKAAKLVRQKAESVKKCVRRQIFSCITEKD